MTAAWVERAIGRACQPEPVDAALDVIRARGGAVLITGGFGSLGLAVADVLADAGIEAIPVDIREVDVTDPVQVEDAMRLLEPSTVLHLAGAKHAPLGELDPMEPVRVHVDGTRNVLTSAPADAVVVTASTCKACDPETAYGATKLIAERMTLNAGQRVARFHNVVETSGNVFETWGDLPDDAPIDVAACLRYFITKAEAVSLLLHAAAAPPGRYAASSARIMSMEDLAKRLYPDREQRRIDARRGDRITEPLAARSERIEDITDHIMRIHSPHDPEPTS